MTTAEYEALTTKDENTFYMLSDAEEDGPKPHASSHATNGADPITPASIGAATMTEVNTAIQTAIGDAIGGSY